VVEEALKRFPQMRLDEAPVMTESVFINPEDAACTTIPARAQPPKISSHRGNPRFVEAAR
jgi:hypothetical protein